MLKQQFVEMTWSNRNKSYYENKGYTYTKSGDKFTIKVTDLTHGNMQKIEVVCDYCFTSYYPAYKNYLKNKSNPYVNKDCCKKCSPKKHKEVCLKKYGVESTNQLNFVLQKKREVLAYSQEFIEKEFGKRGYILIGKYINSNTPVEYICPKHIHEGVKTITYAHLSQGEGCYSCGKDKVRGKNHYNWNGGITELNMFLRDRIRQWTLDSLKSGNFQCDITGDSKELEVHHLYNFSDIVKETLNNLNLNILSKVIEYTRKELKLIEEECIRLHYKYGFGVVLTKEIHKEFHKVYGKHNNTKEQYFEFKKMKLNENISKIKNKINNKVVR